MPPLCPRAHAARTPHSPEPGARRENPALPESSALPGSPLPGSAPQRAARSSRATPIRESAIP